MNHRSDLIVLDRFPDSQGEPWNRLVRDVVGGGSAATPFIAALDAPVEHLLEGVDVEAALAAADPREPADADPATRPSAVSATSGLPAAPGAKDADGAASPAGGPRPLPLSRVSVDA